MDKIILQAQPRNLLGKKVKILRGKDLLPAILYGRKFKSLPLTINSREFLKISRLAGEATLINLEISPKDGQGELRALIRDIQKDPVSDEIIHVDLYKVDMTQEIQTEIPLKFVGVAPAVEELEGNFITNKDTIKVECLPDKLVSEIEVDISSLKTFEDLIHVKDLPVPQGIKVLEDNEDIVCQVTAPLSEEELKAMEEEGASQTEKAQIETIEAEKEAEKAEKAEEAAPEEKEAEEKPPEEKPEEKNG